MLSILLSHWAIYGYVAYMVILVVLCIVYRPRVPAFRGRTRPFPPHARVLTPRPRLRQFH